MFNRRPTAFSDGAYNRPMRRFTITEVENGWLVSLERDIYSPTTRFDTHIAPTIDNACQVVLQAIDPESPMLKEGPCPSK